MSKFFGVLIFFFCFSTKAAFQYGFDVIASVQNSEVAETDINPSNQVFLLPVYEAVLDLRGDLKWTFWRTKIVLRPRWYGYAKHADNYLTKSTNEESKAKIDLTDMFIETIWNRILATTVGLQVFQWGPAEILSPSNPIFHFNARQRGLYYKEKGQVLVRANISLSKDHSLVFIYEPISNNEVEWKAESEFSSKGLLKYEKSWSGTNNYLGLIAGIEAEQNYFVGEYVNFVPYEGYAVYADLKQQQKSKNFSPVANGLAYDMQLFASDIRKEWLTLAVMGVRFESNFDFRIEYIYNETGFNKETLQKAFLAGANFFSRQYSQNLTRFLKPGLELLGKQYIYSSIRIADPFNFKDYNFYSRIIYSLQDESSQASVEMDYSFLDAWTTFASLNHSFGAINSEFAFLNNWQASAGLKYSF